jgi:heme/copper-type cytochrome/quinol oxidase subunit 3
MTATALPAKHPPGISREIDARVGMIVFLASWGMLFATLFFCCAVLRVQSPTWPPPGVAPLPPQTIAIAWVNTALMVASSLILRRALKDFDAGRFSRTPQLIGLVMVCGTVFLGLQIQTWLELWQSGMKLQGGSYQGLFYAITTFHGLHVLAGLSFLIWALPSAVALSKGESGMEAADSTRHRIRVRSVAMFWHFVDIAWLGTFIVVYLL